MNLFFSHYSEVKLESSINVMIVMMVAILQAHG